jgi:dephospho-CoA kinase
MLIGLTGGIATGKSTVSNMLRELGIHVIDADQVAREVVEPGKPAWQEIKEHFGEAVLLPDGQLNRPKLAEIIFNDGSQRKILNGIIHPYIRQEMDRKTEEALQENEVVVLDIPLLFEGGREKEVDKVLVVYVPEEIEVRRLMERDQIDEDYARQKIASQMSIEEKKRRADAYIDNSGSREETKKQLLSILQQWGIDVSQ